MPSLLQLSPELHLSIADFLEHDRSHVESDTFTPYESFTTPSTPAKTPWSQFLPKRDLINLSSCCKVLRDKIAPTIFKEIRLRNRDRSGRSLQAISNSVWTTSVRTIHFQCKAIPPSENQTPKPSDNTLSSSVENILSHLSCFPLLNTLTIQFMFGWTSEEDSDTYPELLCGWPRGDQFNRNEDEDFEKEVTYRALMLRVYDIVTHNTHAGLTSLELRNFTPYGIYSWRTEAWQRFLGTLHDVSIHIRSAQFSEGRFINSMECYFPFVDTMKSMFTPMNNVKHLRFAAPDKGPLGLTGPDHWQLPFSSEHLPLLESLELEFCFVSKALANFIVSHCKTLKRVHLKYCFSGVSCVSAQEKTTWAAFFTSMTKAMESIENLALKEFMVSPSNPLFDYEYETDYVRDGIPIDADSNEDIHLTPRLKKAVKATLKRNRNRRFFAYAYLMKADGLLSTDGGGNASHFMGGQDQADFDRLINMIQRNASRRRREKMILK